MNEKKTIPLWLALLFCFVIAACVYLGYAIQSAHAAGATGTASAVVLEDNRDFYSSFFEEDSDKQEDGEDQEDEDYSVAWENYE